MKVLLDTHTLLWWFADDPALPRQAEALIGDPSNTVLVSAASAWEICTKVRIGKLPTGQALCDDFGGYLDRGAEQFAPQRNGRRGGAFPPDRTRLTGRLALSRRALLGRQCFT